MKKPNDTVLCNMSVSLFIGEPGVQGTEQIRVTQTGDDSASSQRRDQITAVKRGKYVVICWDITYTIKSQIYQNRKKIYHEFTSHSQEILARNALQICKELTYQEIKQLVPTARQALSTQNAMNCLGLINTEALGHIPAIST